MRKKDSIAVLTILSNAGMASALMSATEIMEAPLRFICAFDTVINDIIGPIAILVFVGLGIKYVAAEDDQKERTDAKERMQHVLIGLIILIVGKAIVSFMIVPPNCP